MLITLTSRIDMLPGISVVVEKMSHFNKRGARNKCDGGKDEPFLISVVPGISKKMVQENKIISLT